MSEFPLNLLTPEGPVFQGQAKKLILRTVSGDLCILARHADLFCPLTAGRAVVESAEGRRSGQCSGGILQVTNGKATVLASGFTWDSE